MIPFAPPVRIAVRYKSDAPRGLWAIFKSNQTTETFGNESVIVTNDCHIAICRSVISSWTFRAAFTMTDMLVSVAGLSLLMAIVVVGASIASQKARLARCTANLQVINQGVLSFCNDNTQKLPGISSESSGSLWWFYKEQIKRYVGLTGPSSANDAVFACPNDRGYSDPKPFHLSQRFDYSSYVYNGVTLPGMPNIAGWQLPSIKRPARTLLVMEWTAHAPLSWHKSRTGKSNMPFYTDAQSTVGFVDGHVGFNKMYYDGYNAAYTQDPPAGYDYQYSGN